MIETLEGRRLCSATVGANAAPTAAPSISLVAGILVIDGTPGDDAIAVVQTTDYVGPNADVPRITTEVYVFDPATGLPEIHTFQPDENNRGNHVRTIVADLGNGNDIYDGTTVFCTQLIAGGNGNDLLAGGSANDVLSGATATTPSSAAPATTSSWAATATTSSKAMTATTSSSAAGGKTLSFSNAIATASRPRSSSPF
jgi:Ca2+-binding RTX toxin-like protein